MHFLITAGPTREYLDPVRFLSNASSGRMGLALAMAALRRGHKVTLIIGPIQARLPQKAEIVRVETTSQMAKACFSLFPKVDCLIMTAAVCDYQPTRRQDRKIKKGSGARNLQLKPTIDILTELGRTKKKRQLLIGFALETDHLRRNALAKLKEKHLDYIIANSPASLASDRIDATIISAVPEIFSLGAIDKVALARKLIILVERRRTAI